jgi:hypothetical protein
LGQIDSVPASFKPHWGHAFGVSNRRLPITNIPFPIKNGHWVAFRPLWFLKSKGGPQVAGHPGRKALMKSAPLRFINVVKPSFTFLVDTSFILDTPCNDVLINGLRPTAIRLPDFTI